MIAIINLIIFKYMHLKKYYSNEIFMQPGGIYLNISFTTI